MLNTWEHLSYAPFYLDEHVLHGDELREAKNVGQINKMNAKTNA